VGNEAFLSQHVGDLDGEPARGFLREVAEGLEDFLQARGGLMVVDEHPDYPSTALGEAMVQARGAKLLRVQHHLAHAAAALAEHGAFPAREECAGALILDGTGWGPDGTAWGGEWLTLRGDLAWRRVAFLEPLPLVGGEAAVREPWRVAVAALALWGEAPMLSSLPMASQVSEGRLAAVAKLAMQSSWPQASGAGRLFEAAGALLGLAVVNGWEGESAARLESLAASEGQVEPWREADACLGAAGLKGGLLLCQLAKRVLDGEAPARAAAGFHATFCRLALEVARRSFDRTIRDVALGGGCLVNRILREGLASGLESMGYNPCLPRLVPPGDGGLSYGQAVLGAVAQAGGCAPRLLAP
jgi:hydrogenase maturation protein HypF